MMIDRIRSEGKNCFFASVRENGGHSDRKLVCGPTPTYKEGTRYIDAHSTVNRSDLGGQLQRAESFSDGLNPLARSRTGNESIGEMLVDLSMCSP